MNVLRHKSLAIAKATAWCTQSQTGSCTKACAASFVETKPCSIEGLQDKRRLAFMAVGSFQSVNSGIVYVPDSHPTPSASLSGFGVFLWFFFGLVGRCPLRRRCSLGSLLLLCAVACIKHA